MIEFYIDLVGQYILCLANYQFDFEPEDVFIIAELSRLFKVDDRKRILDGVTDVDKFKEQLRMHTYYNKGISYRPFIDDKFWAYIDRVLNKLENYDFTNMLSNTRKIPVEHAHTLHKDLLNMIEHAMINF